MARYSSTIQFKQVATDVSDDTDDRELAGEALGRSLAHRWSGRHAAISTAGSALLALSFLIYLINLASPMRSASPLAASSCSIRMLFESNDLIGLTTEQVLAEQNSLEPFERELVRSRIAAGFKEYYANFSMMLRERDRETLAKFETFQLTPEHKMAVLTVLKSMSDPRVQDLGRDVAVALQEGMHQGRDGVKNSITLRFSQRLRELQTLREEVMPAALRLHEDSQFDLGLKSENMLVVKAFHGIWGAELRVSPPQLEYANVPVRRLDGKSLMRQSGAILFIVADQARIILDQVDHLSKVFGLDVPVGKWARSFAGAVTFVAGIISCIVESAGDKDKMMLCPLKFASAAVDIMMVMTNFFKAKIGGKKNSDASQSEQRTYNGWAHASTVEDG